MPKHYKAKEVPTEAPQTSSNRTTPSGSTESSSNRSSRSETSQGPAHPFSNIPEAQYVPPSTHNFAVPVEKGKDKEPAYHTIALIQNTKIAEEVYERSMKGPFVTLSPAEFLSLSPEYRQKM